MANQLGATTWHGFSVLALDGTKKIMPYSEQLKAFFGIPSSSYFPQMLTCVLYDVLVKIPLDFGLQNIRPFGGVSPSALCEARFQFRYQELSTPAMASADSCPVIPHVAIQDATLFTKGCTPGRSPRTRT
jgi:hypothetical protein